MAFSWDLALDYLISAISVHLAVAEELHVKRNLLN
jgi:hypothetical protein